MHRHEKARDRSPGLVLSIGGKQVPQSSDLSEALEHPGRCRRPLVASAGPAGT
jgi:hypothetical protein